jgi:hypothetical protein
MVKIPAFTSRLCTYYLNKRTHCNHASVTVIGLIVGFAIYLLHYCKILASIIRDTIYACSSIHLMSITNLMFCHPIQTYFIRTALPLMQLIHTHTRNRTYNAQIKKLRRN